MKKPAWLILCLITVVAGLALSLTNLVTAGPIAEQKLLASNAARIAVFPDADGFTELTVTEADGVDSAYTATRGGQSVGTVLQTTVQGYGGPIEIVMGIDAQGAITGLSVGGSAFAETAGLGTRTRDPEFTDQFIGMREVPKLKQNIDGVSGATISSGAVTAGAGRLYQYWQTLNGQAVETADALSPLTAADQRTVTVQGYGGDFDVTVGVNPDGSIEGVRIQTDTFHETEGLGSQALEPAFLNQFAGKTAPLRYGQGVDAIAGATITSKAVLKAVNEALGVPETAGAQTDEAETNEADADETAATDTTSAEATGTLTALDAPDASGAVQVYAETVQGFAGDILVTVGLDANGVIVSLKVGGPNFAETEYYGAQVQTNTFRDQFIGKSGTLAYGEGVDAIAGATISSNAVLKAINDALQAAGSTDTAAQPASAAPKATAAPLNTLSVQTLDTPDENGAVRICTETVRGFANEIVVTVGLDANGVIVSLKVGGPKFAETEYYGAQAQTNTFRAQFIGKSGTIVYGEGVDAIAGATVTSTAVLKAVNDALQAQP